MPAEVSSLGYDLESQGWTITDSLMGEPFPKTADGMVVDSFTTEANLCLKFINQRHNSSLLFDNYLNWPSDNGFGPRAILVWDKHLVPTIQSKLLCPFRNKQQTYTYNWNRVLPKHLLVQNIPHQIIYRQSAHYLLNIDNVESIQYIILFDFSPDNHRRNDSAVVSCNVVIYYINNLKEIMTHSIQTPTILPQHQQEQQYVPKCSKI